MFAVCGVTPSFMNHSVSNGNPVVMNWGTKLLRLRGIDEHAYTCRCTWVIAVFVSSVAACSLFLLKNNMLKWCEEAKSMWCM
jgi:hypothetical protein